MISKKSYLNSSCEREGFEPKPKVEGTESNDENYLDKVISRNNVVEQPSIRISRKKMK